MLQETRLHRIRSLLSSYNQVSTERLVKDLGVSRETVRRDILELEAEGILRRVHGGIATTDEPPEPPLAIRKTVRAREKRAIARAATRLVHPGQTLFIDAGSTTSLLAEELSSLSGLTIITNGLTVAQKMAAASTARGSNRVLLLGGQINAELDATYGDLTIGEIHRYRADLALLSPVAVSAEHGAASFHHNEAAIAQAMTQQARHLILLADHSKIAQTSRVRYASTDHIHTLVTNRHKDTTGKLDALRKQGVEVILV